MPNPGLIEAPLDILEELRADLSKKVLDNPKDFFRYPNPYRDCRLARLEYSFQQSGLPAFNYPDPIKSYLERLAAFLFAGPTLGVQMIKASNSDDLRWIRSAAAYGTSWTVEQIQAALQLNDQQINWSFNTNLAIWQYIPLRQPLVKALLDAMLSSNPWDRDLETMLIHAAPPLSITTDPYLLEFLAKWPTVPKERSAQIATTIAHWDNAPAPVLAQLIELYPGLVARVAHYPNAPENIQVRFVENSFAYTKARIPFSQDVVDFLLAPHIPDHFHHQVYQNLLASFQSSVPAKGQTSLPSLLDWGGRFHAVLPLRTGAQLGRLLHLTLICSPALFTGSAAKDYITQIPRSALQSIPRSYLAPWLAHSNKNVREVGIYLTSLQKISPAPNQSGINSIS